jgi:hypothetical protein
LRELVHPCIPFLEHILADDTEIRNAVPHIFGYIIVPDCQDVEIKVTAWRIEALFLKFEAQAARAEQSDRIFREASIALDGDFHSSVSCEHTLS